MSTHPGDFHREYDLSQVRRYPADKKIVASHQNDALRELGAWFKTGPSPAGCIVALPTGGGKTFVAVRFLCAGPLSQDYKVLWLAHTHHLLEQAFYSFVPPTETEGKQSGYEIARIGEARVKRSLSLRVVSGTPGHYPAHQIKPDDDIVIGTLQTITRAYQDPHQRALKAFLNASAGKLVVVFDEAHHSLAPSYRQLLVNLRQAYPNLVLLGLTATPTYTDQSKQGWLKTLFPQGIISQVSPANLMANGILAKPNLEQATTHFTPEFDEREYQKWVGTYRDLPEEIIAQLAENRERNAFIVETYIKNKARYGKTIIFANRWFQCTHLEEMLIKRGVRAGSIFSHVDGDPGSVAARNKRSKDENAKVLAAFRRDELDVLINIKMLTEGTDVPDAQTAFLTRQTTSQILMTQMVGRVLRGPRFGGTDQAYIVAFIDNWRQAINWAGYDQLAEGIADETIPEYGKRPPLHLISIDLVRHLARQMDSGLNVNPGSFLSLLPLGWYRLEFQVLAADSEDIETVRQLMMVFEHEQPAYQAFIRQLQDENLDDFAHEQIDLTKHQPRLTGWQKQFFTDIDHTLSGDLITNLFHIARHMAQNEAEPRFFPFEARERHNLDQLAVAFINRKLNRIQENEALKAEYIKPDHYWNVFYPTYGQFKSQFDACVNWQLGLDETRPDGEVTVISDDIVNREPPEEVKIAVKERDGFRCLCCAEDNKRYLQVDHITPSYHGGQNTPDNLQTLCCTCNGLKSARQIDFRVHQTVLPSPPVSLPDTIDFPTADPPKNQAAWEKHLRRTVNFFYQAAVVKSVTLGEAEWSITLHAGNDPAWLEKHANSLTQQMADVWQEASFKQSITLTVAPQVKVVEPPKVQPLPSRAKPAPPPEQVLIAITQRGLITRVPVTACAHGISQIAVDKNDVVKILLVANLSDTLLFFTNREKLYSIEAQAIPTDSPIGQGTPCSQVLDIAFSESITAAIALSASGQAKDLLMVTEAGRIKRTHLTEFCSIRRSGLQVGSKIGWAQCLRHDQDLILVSRDGQAIRFNTNEVRPTGRTAAGIIAIRLQGQDKVAGLGLVAPNAALLVITASGFAKQTPLTAYSPQSRGGSGIRTIADNLKRTGEIVAASVVSSQDEVILISKSGILLRTGLDAVSRQGRTTQGGRIMELNGKDAIVSATVLTSLTCHFAA